MSPDKTKRWQLWCVLVASLMVVAGAVLLWLIQPGRMERTCSLIRPGMTRDEVEALFSEPSPRFIGSPDEAWWSGDDGYVLVVFDEAGRASEPQFLPKTEKSFLGKVRSRLRSWLNLSP